MKKTKTQKGITLIALIITIVVLLILAAVAISSIQNDGILHYATNAADAWNRAQENEATQLQNYLGYLDKYGNGGETTPPLDEGSKILDTNGNDIRNKKVTTNTTAYDKFGNKIVVPAGFMIRVDESTNNADTVIEGIVIEDATKDASGNATSTTGNQFVWIPVGNIKTSTTDTVGTPIILGRYADFTTTPYTPVQTIDNYTETIKIGDESFYYHEDGTVDLIAFLNSATNNKGYYFGRYHAGDAQSTTDRTEESSGTNKMVCKANQIIYNYVGLSNAETLSQGLYSASSGITSDLPSSYAWDTAVVFIKTFKNSGMSNILGLDNQYRDWTTERYATTFVPEMAYRYGEDGSARSSYDYYDQIGSWSSSWSFRPILYIS